MVDIAIIVISATFLYAVNAARGMYPGDAGDLVTAAMTRGVPHPPGFPLYTAIGWLLTRIPLESPAWRMAWLSILPHAITLVLVYAVTLRFTRSRLASFFATLTLMGNYLFFLYSTTPEVFALLDLFVIGLLFLALRLQKRFNTRLFLLFCFGIGLSLTHHPLIVLLFPSLCLLMRRTFVGIRSAGRYVFGALAAICAGLTPWLYIIWAAHGTSIINWDRAITVDRFIKLVTRADYGSFMSGGVIGHSLLERTLNVKAYAVFVLLDFTWVGIILACFGLFWLWKKNRDAAVAFGVALVLLGPAFSFYSSFQIVNRFVLGTVERFALPSYTLMAPLIGMGAYGFCQWMAEKSAFIMHENRKRRQLAILLFAVLFGYPLLIGGMNIWRFQGLATDQTTNQYAEDLLNIAPKNAIVLLVRDTPIFDVQYLRYALGVRPDTVVVHLSRLSSVDYQEILRLVIPDLVIPKVTPQGEQYAATFIKANVEDRPIVSNVMIPVDKDWVWVPHGLLFFLTPRNDAPAWDALIRINEPLWSAFHNPKDGLLSRYKHLFLTNVLDEYAIASYEYGKILLRAGKSHEAAEQFIRSIHFDSDTQSPTAWMYLGLAYSFGKDCKGALAAYNHARQPSPVPDPTLLYYEALTYRDCVGDATHAAELFSQYQAANRLAEPPLEGPQ